MAVTPALLTDILACAATYALYRFIKASKQLPYPPGPKGSLLLGNVNDVPLQRQWIAYMKMSRELDSPMIHLNMLGTHIIIINDHSTAYEIFEKRATRYSDRPRMPMLNEVAGFGWNFGFTAYGERWKTCRRYFDSYFRESEARKLRPQEVQSTHKLLKRLLDTPDDFPQHFRFHSARLILDLGYGIEVTRNDDYYIQVVETALEDMNKTSDQNIVDILPWTQHLPTWLPGMGWKVRTLDWKKHALAMRDEPFDAVKNGTSTKPCMASKLLEEANGDLLIEDMARSTVGTLFSAGTDTTVSVLNCLVLIMLVFPEVQKKAHAELDRVVGHDRLPEFADKPNLPYIEALCKELLRWTCIVPLALPHRAMEDDVWIGPNGQQYLIPQGALVFGNSWAMCRDPNIYQKPDEFEPARYLTSDGQLDPNAKDPDVAFGYRARQCAGRWMAEDILFISVASVLSVFRMESAEKDKVWKNDFDELIIPSLVMRPHPFKCNIVPRHERASELVTAADFNT